MTLSTDPRIPAPRPRSSRPWLALHPDWSGFFQSQGLRSVEDFLAIPGAIINGHPDRSVAKVLLSDSGMSINGYLKIEHCIPWKERWLNAWHGYGFVSKSVREALTLHQLQQYRIPVPQWLAVGESAEGNAFLLLQGAPDVLPLPKYLKGKSRSASHRIAWNLGHLLGRLHRYGFDHPDLYASHVLVHPGTEAITLIDWQRTRKRQSLPDQYRIRDLAALRATIPDALLTPTTEALFLRAYLKATHGQSKPFRVTDFADRIQQATAKLRQRRHIRSKLRRAGTEGRPLISLKGEQLQVTPAFQKLWDPVPEWLASADTGEQILSAPNGTTLHLSCAIHQPPRLSRWSKSPWISPQRARMNLLNRLRHYGIHTPTVLAVGDVPLLWGNVKSFLLTARQETVGALSEVLSEGDLEPKVRRDILRQAGHALATIHQSGCFFTSPTLPLAIATKNGTLSVVLADEESLTLRKGRGRSHRLENLQGLLKELKLEKTDRWRVLRSYLQTWQPERIRVEARRLWHLWSERS